MPPPQACRMRRAPAGGRPCPAAPCGGCAHGLAAPCRRGMPRWGEGRGRGDAERLRYPTPLLCCVAAGAPLWIVWLPCGPRAEPARDPAAPPRADHSGRPVGTQPTGRFCSPFRRRGLRAPPPAAGPCGARRAPVHARGSASCPDLSMARACLLSSNFTVYWLKMLDRPATMNGRLPSPATSLTGTVAGILPESILCPLCTTPMRTIARRASNFPRGVTMDTLGSASKSMLI